MMLFYKFCSCPLVENAPHITREKKVEEKVTTLSYLDHWSSPRAKRFLDLNTVDNVVSDLESHDPYMTNHRELQAMDTVGIGGEIVEGGN